MSTAERSNKIQMVALMLVLTFSAYFMSVEATNRDQRLLKECMSDGNKEYVCRGLLRGQS